MCDKMIYNINNVIIYILLINKIDDLCCDCRWLDVEMLVSEMRGQSSRTFSATKGVSNTFFDKFLYFH